ncbi:hypothetical protein EW145_g2337 [Phellinidium pouzarii]|uniref:Alpha/beta hydrolase fold-3 domain-containing protein n=1 Tax=Phellinidium pouzarii TaxID=167371 RepID=A0A4V3XDA4_9AGAM|nr:hypothetical protein EW145_g2337 [Phellinidium pouzarii]
MKDEKQQLDLDIPNNRSIEFQPALEVGVLFRLLVDAVSLPVLLALDKNRFKTTVNTGKTGKCRLCIYIPKSFKAEETPRGVVVHLHGGGWTIPETEAPICRYMADNAGVVVIAPNYRKAPEYPYPHALEQNYLILRWVANGGLASVLRMSHINGASSLRIDSTRIALSGGSAGSNLACALATLAVSRPLPNGACIAAQALLYPALNLSVPYVDKLARVDAARVLPQWMSRFFLHAYLPPPRDTKDPLISPALASDEIVRALPPTIILTAAYDHLAYEADEFSTRLSREGVCVRHRRFEDVGHGFDGIPTTDKRQRMLNDKARDEAWGMIVQLMRETLT